jgi:hypothetical protein
MTLEETRTPILEAMLTVAGPNARASTRNSSARKSP